MNYYDAMTSGLYKVTVPRMALYDASAANKYIKSTSITNTGELVTVEDEYLDTAITILTMIEVWKKGYPIMIQNPKMIKEIVEIVYGHITVCIDAKHKDILGRHAVPVEDLMDMEEFMIAIVEHHPANLVDQFRDSLASRMTNVGMKSMFEDDDVAVAKNNEVDAFRRVTDVDIANIQMSDLLNTL